MQKMPRSGCTGGRGTPIVGWCRLELDFIQWMPPCIEHGWVAAISLQRWKCSGGRALRRRLMCHSALESVAAKLICEHPAAAAGRQVDAPSSLQLVASIAWIPGLGFFCQERIVASLPRTGRTPRIEAIYLALSEHSIPAWSSSCRGFSRHAHASFLSDVAADEFGVRAFAVAASEIGAVTCERCVQRVWSASSAGVQAT